MVKKISLRLRLSLVTAFVLVFIIVILTLFSMYNANLSFVQPLTGLSAQAVPAVPAAPENGQAGQSVQDVAATGAAIFRFYSLIFMVVAVIGGSLLVYVIAGYALKPVKSLSTQINGIDGTELGKRVTGFRAKDEIHQLADSFNHMMERLEIAFLREKRFASDAAHELKTPLTVIKTNLDVLELDKSPTEEEYRLTLGVLRKQSDRMIRLVDDLFAMVALGEAPLTDVVPLDQLLSEIIDELKPLMDEKHLDVSTQVVPCTVRANHGMLLRGFSNILENAIKYNLDGGSIEVSSRIGDGVCSICISDTGIGIPPEQAEHIFEPFYRVDPSRSRQIGGAGLGLAIARTIMEHHGGSLCYLPAETPGSSFEAKLPIHEIY